MATKPTLRSVPADVLPIAPLAAVNFDPKSVTNLDGVLPWRVVGGYDGLAAVLDANGRTLLISNGRIARRVAAAVNMVECAYRVPIATSCGND